jgi:hypothetical protein
MSTRNIPEPRLPRPKRQFSLNVDHGPLLMKHTFEHAELSDGTGDREQGEEHLRDEKRGREWMTKAALGNVDRPIRVKA